MICKKLRKSMEVSKFRRDLMSIHFLFFAKRSRRTSSRYFAFTYLQARILSATVRQNSFSEFHQVSTQDPKTDLFHARRRCSDELFPFWTHQTALMQNSSAQMLKNVFETFSGKSYFRLHDLQRRYYLVKLRFKTEDWLWKLQTFQMNPYLGLFTVSNGFTNSQSEDV